MMTIRAGLPGEETPAADVGAAVSGSLNQFVPSRKCQDEDESSFTATVNS